MGTRANTKIKQDKDYIELYTRWDGFTEEIKESILNIPEQWQEFIDLSKKTICETDFGTTEFSVWLDDLQNYLNQHKNNPNIESTSFFLSAKSFTHHHPLVAATSDSDNDWGRNNPDLIAKISNGKFSFTCPNSSHNKTNELKSLDDFKILRIKMMSVNDNDNSYIDLKFKDIDLDNIIKRVLLLPMFWRDFYTIYKKSLAGDGFRDSSIPAVSSLARKLTYFYKPTKKYQQFMREKNDVNFNKNEKDIAIDEIFEDVKSMIPFDLYVNSLATQIAFIFAGKMTFLTQQEQNSVQNVDLTIYLTDSRLSKIFFELSDDKFDSLDVVTKQESMDSKYTQYHGVNSRFPYVFIKNKANKLIGIPYEENLVHLMENQREIELKELGVL